MTGIRIKNKSVEQQLTMMFVGLIVYDGSGMTQKEMFNELLDSVEITIE